MQGAIMENRLKGFENVGEKTGVPIPATPIMYLGHRVFQ